MRSWAPRIPSNSASAVLLLALCSSCCSLLAAAARGGAAQQQRGGDAVRFDFRGCGGARQCLGVEKLEAVRRKAGRMHKSVDDLADELERDADLGVDLASDMLVYSCAGLDVPPGTQPPGAAADAAAAAAAAAGSVDGTGSAAGALGHRHHHHHHHRHLLQSGPGSTEITSGWLPDAPDAALSVAATFALHSRPGAAKKILLDFTGHTTSGTQWNSWKGVDPIVTPPYDTDGSPTTWSASELADILAVWRGVAEDYAPFNVDVTTEDPGDAYLATNGIRVAIGGSCNDWYGSTAGGVAFVGVFGSYNLAYAPAFIFPRNLGPNVAKFIWEAASHEVGHTLGLSHDGTNTTGYYGGVPGGIWGPIMGVGYQQPLTQFSKGEYAAANNLEDDFVVMSGYLGPVTASPQAYGTSPASATPLAGAANADGASATAVVAGVVRQPGEADVFSFAAGAAGAASLQLLATPAWTGPGGAAYPRGDLRALLTVSDAAGRVVAAADGVGLPAPLAASLPGAGTYYVSVAGAGFGDPVNGGYSAYGSRGAYELVVTYPLQQGAGPSPPPSPSPSPAPPPSPSPAPLPSPSPAPPPSPSPAPLPSPSPSPPRLMTITSIKNSYSRSGNWMRCLVVVTVVDTASGAGLAGVSLGGTWGSLLAFKGFPYSETLTTAADGSVSSPSRGLPTAGGNGCTYALSGASLAGYVLDTAGSVMAAPTRMW